MFIIGTYARYLNGNCVSYNDIDVYGTKEDFDNLLNTDGLYVNPNVFENHYIVLTRGLKDKAIEFSVVPQSLLTSLSNLELKHTTLKGSTYRYANTKTDELIMWAIRHWNVKEKHTKIIKKPSMPCTKEELVFYREYLKYLAGLYGPPKKRKLNNECE